MAAGFYDNESRPNIVFPFSDYYHPPPSPLPPHAQSTHYLPLIDNEALWARIVASPSPPLPKSDSFITLGWFTTSFLLTAIHGRGHSVRSSTDHFHSLIRTDHLKRAECAQWLNRWQFFYPLPSFEMSETLQQRTLTVTCSVTPLDFYGVFVERFGVGERKAGVMRRGHALFTSWLPKSVVFLYYAHAHSVNILVYSWRLSVRIQDRRVSDFFFLLFRTKYLSFRVSQIDDRKRNRSFNSIVLYT